MKKKLTKKGIGWEAFARLLIALIFVVIAYRAFEEVFRLSDQGLDSFYTFGSELEKLKEGELQSMPLIMDDNTAIIAFSKDTDSFTYNFKTKEGLIFGSDFFYFIVYKPNSCEKGKACICLCREGLALNVKDSSNIIECSEYRCQPLEKTDFPKKYTPSFESGRDISKDEFYNGFFLMRGEGPGFAKFAATDSDLPELVDNKDADQRRRTIYLDKKEGSVKLYEKSQT